MTKQERIEWFSKEFENHRSPYITHGIVTYLVDVGFFDAPASTKNHSAYEGGLFDHSKAVYENLVKLTKSLGLHWAHSDSPFIVAMLHDLCKCDQYEKDGDAWKYRTDTLLTGHGEKSVMMLASLDCPFEDEEIACIRYHMGAFTDSKEWSSYTNAIHKYPNVLWLHTADMMAAHIDMV